MSMSIENLVKCFKQHKNSPVIRRRWSRWCYGVCVESQESSRHVEVVGNYTRFWYCGTMLAEYDGANLKISNGGWYTNTTKNYLNRLLGLFGLDGIYQKHREWYFTNGEKFEGEKVFENVRMVA